MSDNKVRVTAELQKVQNLANEGGYRITLDLPQSLQVEAAHLLVMAGQTGKVFRVEIEMIDAEPGDFNG